MGTYLHKPCLSFLVMEQINCSLCGFIPLFLVVSFTNHRLLSSIQLLKCRVLSSLVVGCVVHFSNTFLTRICIRVIVSTILVEGCEGNDKNLVTRGL